MTPSENNRSVDPGANVTLPAAPFRVLEQTEHHAGRHWLIRDRAIGQPDQRRQVAEIHVVQHAGPQIEHCHEQRQEHRCVVVVRQACGSRRRSVSASDTQFAAALRNKVSARTMNNAALTPLPAASPIASDEVVVVQQESVVEIAADSLGRLDPGGNREITAIREPRVRAPQHAHLDLPREQEFVFQGGVLDAVVHGLQQGRRIGSDAAGDRAHDRARHAGSGNHLDQKTCAGSSTMRQGSAATTKAETGNSSITDISPNMRPPPISIGCAWMTASK